MYRDTREVAQQALYTSGDGQASGEPVLVEHPTTEHVTFPELDGRFSYFISTTQERDIEALPDGQTRDVTILNRLNDVRRINTSFRALNAKLPEGGFYTGCVETSEQRKRRILETYPAWIAWPYYILCFLFHRVLPKLKATRRLYFAVTKGRGRVLSKAEVLGRLLYCGFEIVDYREIGEEMYYVVQKAKSPIYDVTPSIGPLLKIKRVGQGGRETYVYKLRTMHPYAEFLQAYIHEQHQLEQNGKFKDDFRITTWGGFLRKVWIDELPMLINLTKGDVKLFGVRPLSEHYLSLYPKELAERRLQHKPGLIPPFYVDIPNGFEEILQSEERYLQCYEQNPVKTDVQYFCRAVYNIAVKRVRSA